MTGKEDAAASTADINTRVVLDGYEAFKTGDIERLLAHLADDVDWEVLGTGDRLPSGGNRRGKEEVRRFFQEVAESFDFSNFEVRQTISQGDHVVVLGRYAGTARPTGRPVASEWAMAYRLRGGKVVWFREYSDTAAVMESFAVSPRAGLEPEARPRHRPS